MKNILIFLILLSSINLFEIYPQNNKEKEAWEKLCNNNFTESHNLFLSVIESDKNNLRANLGLYYLNRYKGNMPDAWNYFKNIIDSETSFQPYLYSSLLVFNSEISASGKDGEIPAVLKKAIDYPDHLKILPAMIKERFIEFYSERGNNELSQKYNSEINAILNWQIIGPFDNISASGFDKIFPPETEFNENVEYTGKNGVPAKWFPINKVRPDGWIDFNRYFAFNEAVFYGNTFIYSPQNQKVLVRAGTSGSLKIFLNDFMIYDYFDENNNDLDTYIIETELNKGWNRLLIKCGFSEISNCNFLIRLSDTEGNDLTGIEYSAENQKYTKAANLYSQFIPNFAEEYFLNNIKNQSSEVENYLLLADSYLRNDKAIEAELILKEGMKQYPNSALFLTILLEAYLRGEKYDEASSVREKLYLLDNENSLLIAAKIGENLRNQDYTAAEELLNKLTVISPESQLYYTTAISLHAKKGNIEKLIALSKEAFEKYPLVWEFANIEMTIHLALKNDLEGALNIVDKYIQNINSKTALYNKGAILQKLGRIKEWEKTYLEILEIDPAAVGYLHEMAKTFYARQDYDKAEKYIREALDICPNSTYYWAQLAEIQRVTENKNEAENSYKKSLKYNHSNFDSRDKLRELQGKPQVYSYFKKFNVDSLVKNSPTSTDRPDDQLMIILDKLDRVVYEEGASEYSREMLIRTFNTDGINTFKEFYIPYNPYSEGLIVEKAVVIKKDGTQVQADSDDNHIIFKSLESNDFIYLKWKVKNFYNGKLSDQFWDEFYFNYYYPVKYISYSLLIPENKKFNYSAQNMSKDPVSVTKTADGKLYEWTIKEQPGLKYEYNMPSITEVGKALFISSLDNWNYLVDWYKDITYTKVRPSYEIKETVKEITANIPENNIDEKIKKIYEYITENIQYSSVSFRQSAFTPQSARDVLVTKIGDCKDLATLCIAMLSEIGVSADYVLVNTKDQGLNKNILPSIAFNHAIVSVNSNKGPIYLDLTAQNYPFAALPEPDRGAFSLIIKNGNANSIYLDSENIIQSEIIRDTKCQLTSDNKINLFSNNTRKGAAVGNFKANFRYLGSSEKHKTMSESLAQEYPNMVLNKFETGNIDSSLDIINYTLDMTIPDYLTEAGDFKMLKIPWSDKLLPLKALSYENRTYPFLYWPSADKMSETFEIEIPQEYIPVNEKGTGSFSYNGGSYNIKYEFKNNKIVAERNIVFRNREIDVKDYQDFKSFYNNVLKSDEQVILLKKK
ncbi:MAG: DUF3857 domain-containing protein [Ignavibacteria bacterium]|nr:DUF3857 domain-containing protein [Ignavibacteria bacterium]